LPPLTFAAVQADDKIHQHRSGLPAANKNPNMINQLMNALITLLLNTSALEWACNLTSLACVILAAKNRVLTWPFGITSCVLFTVLFVDAKLYAEAVLQLFFIATSVWGWWHWSAQRGKPAAPIRTIAAPTAALLVVGVILAGALYAWGLQRWTDAASPWLDSQVLTLSMLAQWWLMQRKVSCWWLWLAVNTVSVPLYASRELYVSAAFYALYWVLAIVAFYTWRQALAQQAAIE
jgi:nicotinamide mononucleotide transporter